MNIFTIFLKTQILIHYLTQLIHTKFTASDLALTLSQHNQDQIFNFRDCKNHDVYDICSKYCEIEPGYAMHSDLILEECPKNDFRVIGMTKAIEDHKFKQFSINLNEKFIFSPTSYGKSELVCFSESNDLKSEIIGVYNFEKNTTRYLHLLGENQRDDHKIIDLNLTLNGNSNTGNPQVYETSNNTTAFVFSFDSKVYNYSLDDNQLQFLINFPEKQRSFYPVAKNKDNIFIFLDLFQDETIISYKLTTYKIENNIVKEHLLEKPLNFRDYEIRHNKRLWLYNEKYVRNEDDWFGQKIQERRDLEDVIATIRVIDLDTLKDCRVSYYLPNTSQYQNFRYFTVSYDEQYIAMLFNRHIKILKVSGNDLVHYNSINIDSQSCINLFFLPNNSFFCQDFSMTTIKWFDINLGVSKTNIPMTLCYIIIGFSSGFVTIVVVIILYNCILQKRRKKDQETQFIEHSGKKSYVLNTSSLFSNIDSSENNSKEFS